MNRLRKGERLARSQAVVSIWIGLAVFVSGQTGVVCDEKNTGIVCFRKQGGNNRENDQVLRGIVENEKARRWLLFGGRLKANDEVQLPLGFALELRAATEAGFWGAEKRRLKGREAKMGAWAAAERAFWGTCTAESWLEQCERCKLLSTVKWAPTGACAGAVGRQQAGRDVMEHFRFFPSGALRFRWASLGWLGI